jgi:hypothetical protein
MGAQVALLKRHGLWYHKLYPGYEKMKVIAKAMGFPSEAWFEESSAAPFVERAAPGGSSGRYLWWVVAFFGR